MEKFTPKPSNDDQIAERNGVVSRFVLPLFIALIFVAATWTTWRWLWGEWMSNEYYSHGILILPVALYLAWRRVRNIPSNDVTDTNVTSADVNGTSVTSTDATDTEQRTAKGKINGLILLGGALVLYLFFVSYKAYYLSAFALIFMIAGVVWTLFGLSWLRMLAFPIGYLFLMVPLPFVERITLPLALFTGVCSTALVKFFGLELTVTGNAITLPNADLVIGAQCSGINSMITLIALTALCAYILQGPWWGKTLLVLLAVPIAMLGNILRVSNLLVVARYWGADAAFRFYHDYSGIVFFLVVLLLLVPTTRVLQCKTLRLDVL